MIEFLKRAYAELYDLPHYYLKIEGEWQCHAFSILFLIIMLLVGIWITKQTIQFVKTGKKDRKKIEKTIIKLYDQDKNKKNKNVR